MRGTVKEKIHAPPGSRKMRKELTVVQASRKLGVTLDALYRLIRAAKIPARKEHGCWLIPVAAIENRLKMRAARDGK